MTQNAKELIKAAQRRRKATRINLRGDLRAEVEALEIDLRDLQQEKEEGTRSNARLTDVSPALELANRIQGLREQMIDSWLDLVLETQPWADWRTFKTANPAREGDEYDQVVGVNFDVLVTEFMPKCVVEPPLDAEDWEGIFSKASPGDLRDLGGVVYDLHETGSQVPKSRLASAVTRASGDESGRLATGASASDDTTAGSQESSTSTTTGEATAVEPETPGPPSSPENKSGMSWDETEPKG